MNTERATPTSASTAATVLPCACTPKSRTCCRAVPSTRSNSGSRTSSRGASSPRVLLLRRVLGAVSQGGRARRDDDEHPPWLSPSTTSAASAACSTVRPPGRLAIVFAASSRRSASSRSRSQRRQLLRLRRRERVAPGALRPPLRLGDGDRARRTARHQRAADVAQRDEGSGAGIGSYLAALPQLPYQFFTQAKYASASASAHGRSTSR